MRFFPFTIVPLILYNLIAFVVTGLIATAGWNSQVFAITLFSGASWTLSWGDLIVVLGLAMLFVEILGAATLGRRAMLNHVISILVLLVYVIEFLVVAKAATSPFFILMIISLIDVLAGVIITIRMASRDVSIGTMA